MPGKSEFLPRDATRRTYVHTRVDPRANNCQMKIYLFANTPPPPTDARAIVASPDAADLQGGSTRVLRPRRIITLPSRGLRVANNSNDLTLSRRPSRASMSAISDRLGDSAIVVHRVHLRIYLSTKGQILANETQVKHDVSPPSDNVFLLLEKWQSGSLVSSSIFFP